ncbi:MAG: hypothetical protein GC183_01225 [Thiobacillus sp.]|nr:hypothetical protein [Thiobacillus sp.]
MKYLTCIGLPLLLQAGFTLLIINAAPGGSFVGLGALLFAGIGIPITAVLLFPLARDRSGRSGYGRILRLVLLTLALPLAQLGLLVLVTVFRL